MSKNLVAILLLSSFLTLPFAGYTEEAAEKDIMDKDSWLNAMAPLLPGLICKGFIQNSGLKARFDELKISYEQCLPLISESSAKCQKSLYGSIPDVINEEVKTTWGKTLGACIGRDFAAKYLTRL